MAMNEATQRAIQIGTQIESMVKEYQELMKSAEAHDQQAKADRLRAGELKKAASELQTALRTQQVQDVIVTAQQEALKAREEAKLHEAEIKQHLEDVKAMKAELAAEIERAKSSIYAPGTPGGDSDPRTADGLAPASSPAST